MPTAADPDGSTAGTFCRRQYECSTPAPPDSTSAMIATRNGAKPAATHKAPFRSTGDLFQDGWQRQTGLPHAAVRNALAAAVHAVRSGRGQNAFLDPRLWTLVSEVGSRLTPLLGEDCALLPHLWLHWVDGYRGNSRRGWPEHQDQRAPSVIGPPGFETIISLSAWIPLTPARKENGAIWVRPFRRDRATIPALCLEADPGEVLIWRQDLRHWGGRFDPVRAPGPRVAMALEFQSRRFAPRALPLMDPRIIPSLDRRRRLIDGARRAYAGFDAATRRSAGS